MTEKEIYKYLDELNKHTPMIYGDNIVKAIKGLLDELQQENTSLKKEIKLMKSVNINENFISKDKIRNKINELEKEKDKYFKENGLVPSYLQKLIYINNKIEILEELLGDDINEI